MNDASTWARARSPAQKRAREEEVLDAAARLLSTRPFASISLSDLAGEVSFSRANLYKYFGSKEEVYLALMARSAERFARSMIATPSLSSPLMSLARAAAASMVF